MSKSSHVVSAVPDATTGFAGPRPMRRGSLSERYVKCSKPGCACAQREDARHGPYFSLTRAVGGKTHSRFLSGEQAAIARRQIEAGREFRRQVEAYWEVCEKCADAELEGGGATAEGAGKKGGSAKPSARKSSPRSSR